MDQLLHDTTAAQRTRAWACKEARAVLGARGFASSAEVDPQQVLFVANYIVAGLDLAPPDEFRSIPEGEVTMDGTPVDRSWLPR